MSSHPPTNLEVARSVRLRPITEVAAEMGLDPRHVELFGWHKAKVELDALPEEAARAIWCWSRHDTDRCRRGQDHHRESSGYFCAQPCSQDSTCPDFQSCKEGGASGCATCLDLIDICE